VSDYRKMEPRQGYGKARFQCARPGCGTTRWLTADQTIDHDREHTDPPVNRSQFGDVKGPHEPNPTNYELPGNTSNASRSRA